jgi:hypothetical protein
LLPAARKLLLEGNLGERLGAGKGHRDAENCERDEL